MERIIVDGITVKVMKKKIKNMYLRINKKREVVVSAPLFLSDREIEQFVFSKAEWLKEALMRTEKRVVAVPSFDDGEERCLLGKKYVLHTDTSREKGYYFDGNDIVICVGKKSTAESRKKALAEVYRKIMEQILPDMAEECQNSSGLYANEWRVRDMTTRWGSCNTKEKRIWISLWLIEKPIECIKAVIFHELAHLKVRGHNKQFYAQLEKICPYYKQAEKILKNK